MMNIPIRLLLVVCAALATAWSPAHAQADAPPRTGGLRYDGVYQLQDVEWTTSPSGRDSMRFWSYLRFTPDGMVVHFGTNTGEPDDLGNFSLANKLLPDGAVTVRDGRLSFSVVDEGPGFGPVRVDYEGHIDGDRLYLHIHSHYNGYRADQVFAFIPIAASRLRQWDGIRPE